MNIKCFRIAFVAGIASVLTGCITSVKTSYTPETTYSAGERTSKSVAYNFVRTSRCSTNDEFDKNDYSTDLKGAWAAPQNEGTALNQFRSTFSRRVRTINPTVNKTGGDCDIFMDIMQQNSWNGLGLFGAAISGFTWTIIPCWGDDTYTLYAEVSNKMGKKKTYQLTGAVTTVTWLPFIFGTPFTGLPGTRVDEVTQAHWTELLNRMEQDGFFDSDAQMTESYTLEQQKKIAELKKLKDEGLMTKDEFDATVKRLTSK